MTSKGGRLRRGSRKEDRVEMARRFRQQDVRRPPDIPVLSDANSLVFQATRQLCDNSMSRRLLLRAATAAWPPSSSTKAIYVTFSFVASLSLSLSLSLWMIAPFF